MIREIPPHIFWPGLVVSILLMSVSVNMFFLMKATSDNGPQIIDDYYSNSSEWDESQAKIRRANALDWSVDLTLEPAASAKTGILKAVFSKDGAPLEDLHVALTLRDPTQIAIVAHEDATHFGAGHYSAAVPLPRAGLWDVDIHGSRGSEVYEMTIRLEVVE